MKRPPPDDYYVLMWNFIEPMFSSGPELADKAIARFREIACNGATLIASYADHPNYQSTSEELGLPKLEHLKGDSGDYRYGENRFPFYVMNLARILYWSWGAAKPVFKEQYASFEKDRDRSVFVRKPCVNNPDNMRVTLERTAKVMEALKPMQDLSLLYDWRDELSVTSFLLASDCDFSEDSLQKMREWLKGQYADLDALNAEWDTGFASWDEVEPIVTQEALERREAGDWNFAPWADHRTFMNVSLARACAEIKEEVLKHDPDALSGPTGTQCPSVYGGYDLSLMTPVSDWVEAYDFGNSVDCFRSFKPRREYPIIKTDFSKADVRLLDAMLWTYVFQAGGYGGTIIWESNSLFDVDSPELTPTDNAVARGKVYSELRSGIPRLLQRTDEVNSPVAVHYSQASINADFITSVPARWRSVAAYEPERFPAFDARMVWWKLLEDRGLRPVFVSSAQVEAGELIQRGIRLLVLPRSIAISDAEAEQMTRFVEAGGVLVGDSAIGRMDEHCREREAGALDALFGVTCTLREGYYRSEQRASLDWDATTEKRPRWGGGPHRAECSFIEDGLEPADDTVVMGCSEYSSAPIGFRRKAGKGQAILFNACPLEYLQARRGAEGGIAYQEFFGRIVELAGADALARVTDLDGARLLPGWRTWAFRHGKATYIGISPDLQISQDVLGGITGDTGEGKGRGVRISLSARGYVYEARSGRSLGFGDTVADTLNALSARLYSVLPYRVSGVELQRVGNGVTARVLAEKGMTPGEHVLRFEVLDAAGRRVPDSGANIVTNAEGVAEGFECEIPEGGRVTCRDTASGVRGECD